MIAGIGKHDNIHKDDRHRERWNRGTAVLPGEGNKKIVNEGTKMAGEGFGNRNTGPTMLPEFPPTRDRLPKNWPDILAFAAVGFAWLGVIVYTL